MVNLDEVQKTFRHSDSSEVNEIIRLLKTEGNILDITSQYGGGGLYVKYAKDSNYHNYTEVLQKLYVKHGLVVSAVDFDSNNGERCLWLSTTKHMKEITD